MKEGTRRLFWGATAVLVCAASLAAVYPIVSRRLNCDDLICQLHSAAVESRIADLPLGAFVLLGALFLVFVVAIFQLSPKRLQAIGRWCMLAICIGGFVLALRATAIEMLLLHSWSWSCVVAGWLCSLILCAGIFLAAVGRYPRSRFQGGSVALGGILVAGLSWHLMESGGITRVRKLEDTNMHVLSSDQGHRLGSNSARIQIVEFADFQCPPCRKVAPDLQALVAKYNGAVRLVQRELPNVKRHPGADREAEIAECFGEQGKFWNVATELYRSASIPDDTQLGTWAGRFGADHSQLMSCMNQHRGLAAMAKDRQDARALGVSVTPTLFIGNTVLEGSAPLDKLEGLLRSEMAGHPQTVESASERPIPASSGCSVNAEADSASSKKDAACR